MFLCLFVFLLKLPEEEEEAPHGSGVGFLSAIGKKLHRSVRGVSWSFVLIAAPLVIWIFSLDSDITNIFWE